MTLRSACLVFAPLAIFVLALNPYVITGLGDNLAYYAAAKNLAAHGVYEFEGAPIPQWPPGFPAMLALLFLTGFDSIWAAKLVVLACAAAGMFLSYVLLRREEYPQAAFVVLIAWLLPETMEAGTSIMTEVPYTAVSLGFLYLLHVQRGTRRGLLLAILAGLLLGLASLTRLLGVVLGAAVVAQAVMQWRARTSEPAWRRCLPEAVTALVGAAIFSVWAHLSFGSVLGVAVVLEKGPPAGTVVWDAPEPSADNPWTQWTPLGPGQESPEDEIDVYDMWDFFYSQPRILRGIDSASNLLFRTMSLQGAAGLPLEHPVRYLFMLPLLLIPVGVIHRFRKKRGSPTDYYVWAMILLLTKVGWHEFRYWVPVAPFLVAYMFEGASVTFGAAARRIRLPGVRFIPRALAAAWLLFVVAYAADRLLKVNLPHGPLLYFASPTAEQFYHSGWGDLYRCADAMRKDPAAGPVTFAGRTEPWAGFTSVHDYLEHFSGREVINYPPKVAPAFLLVPAPNEVPPTLIEKLRLELVVETPAYKVYRPGK